MVHPFLGAESADTPTNTPRPTHTHTADGLKLPAAGGVDSGTSAAEIGTGSTGFGRGEGGISWGGGGAGKASSLTWPYKLPGTGENSVNRQTRAEGRHVRPLITFGRGGSNGSDARKSVVSDGNVNVKR